MKISYKIILASLFFASFSFAGNECVNLCTSCQGKSDDATCKNVNSICQCKAALDSAKAKNAVLDASKKKLIEDISKGCDKKTCAREFTFENGSYQKMEKGRSNLSTPQLTTGIRVAEQKNSLRTPQAIKAKDAELDGLMMQRTAITSVKMSPECTSQCNACSTPKDSAQAATPAPAATTPADSATQAATATTPADSATQAATTAVPGDTTKLAAAPADSSAKTAPAAATPAAPANTVATPADSAAQAPANALAAPAADSITPVDSVALAARADSIARADSLAKVTCKRTEAICRCSEQLENAKRLAELDSVIDLKRKESDSLAKEKPALLRAEQAMAIADTTHALCDIKGKCTFSVTFTAGELTLIELHKVDDAPDAAAVAAPAPVVQEPEAAPAPQENCALSPAGQDSSQDAPADSGKKDKDRIFYKVMDITFAQLTESDYFLKNYTRFPFEENKAIEGRVAYLLRWYFYDAGAVSLGMGTTYRYNKFEQDESAKGKKDGYKIDYHSLAIDAPISVRLGVPKIPYVRPFVSETFMFTKPIYELALVRTSAELDGKKVKKFNYFANAPKDWEYSVWLGFGLELTRHFSLEYQMMLGSKKNGHAHIYDTDGSWRVVAGFAW